MGLARRALAIFAVSAPCRSPTIQRDRETIAQKMPASASKPPPANLPVVEAVENQRLKSR